MLKHKEAGTSGPISQVKKGSCSKHVQGSSLSVERKRYHDIRDIMILEISSFNVTEYTDLKLSNSDSIMRN